MSNNMDLSRNDLKVLLKAQKNEITELYIYRYLAQKEQNLNNKNILNNIASEEEKHYQFLRKITGREFKSNFFKVKFYTLLAKFLGLSFVLKLMEKGERLSLKTYQALAKVNEEFARVFQEEQRHEEQLIKMLSDTRLAYTGSFVLGLNDALVELTGVLAGLTLSLANTKLIAFVGFITGIAASLSMASSEYLSTKEEGLRHPGLAALITGIAYFFTVLLLVFPFVIFDVPVLALLTTLILGSIVIFFFNFYVSVVKDVSLKERFLEMIAISFGVAIFNFFLGFLIKKTFGIDI